MTKRKISELLKSISTRCTEDGPFIVRVMDRVIIVLEADISFARQNPELLGLLIEILQLRVKRDPEAAPALARAILLRVRLTSASA